VVNAGSTSLKLSLVAPDGSARPLERLEDARGRPLLAAGHRVVHGGARFREPTELDDAALAAIDELTPIAPLHNGPALAAIEETRRLFPELSQVAVFDTAFHATIPPEAFTYAVPARWREEWGIRRYGFHGISVAWVAEQVLVRRLVVCHLGGGCSVTAVLDGRSVDTTMGFSPLEGVPMATRSGSVDPGALLNLLSGRGVSVGELERALEHESGLAALGGLDDPLGFGVYTYRIACAVGAAAAALGGADAIAFTGGVGEHREDVREAVCSRVAHLGAAVRVVPAREELVIAREVRALVVRGR